jgi:hypothetical protein
MQAFMGHRIGCVVGRLQYKSTSAHPMPYIRITLQTLAILWPELHWTMPSFELIPRTLLDSPECLFLEYLPAANEGDTVRSFRSAGHHRRLIFKSLTAFAILS